METTIKSIKTQSLNTHKESTIWKKIEFSRFGIISMLVVILGCCGGLAASFGAKDDTLKLAMIAFPTIISLALILAVAPMRAIVYLSVIAIILDLIILLF